MRKETTEQRGRDVVNHIFNHTFPNFVHRSLSSYFRVCTDGVSSPIISASITSISIQTTVYYLMLGEYNKTWWQKTNAHLVAENASLISVFDLVQLRVTKED